MMVLVGIERLRERNFDILQGKRIGLMTNAGATDSQFNSTVDILYQNQAVDLRALFSPEHGFAAVVPDATSVEHSIDATSGLPIYSLYGSHYKPSADMLQDIDLMVCDIQDLGVRFYTYIWTVSYILEACGEHGVEVVILDRPNPLGNRIDGAPLETAFASFVGRFNIPQQHGMTIGELALLINQEWNPTPAQLQVIPCYGWQRWMMWSDTGLPFVTTSPGIPTIETVYHYPGTCLIEGTQLSEGRGTALPFSVVGAPFIANKPFATTMNEYGMAGVCFRPYSFLPRDNKFRDRVCYGVQAHIVDRRTYRPIPVWLEVIRTARMLYPEQFAWLPLEQDYYERGSVYHFDRLMGSNLRQQIEAGATVTEIMHGWEDAWSIFAELREPHLLYN